MKKITAKDVAEATGYSRRSVYAALSNSSDLSQSTRELIQKTAREMGYSVDPIFSELGRRQAQASTVPLRANLIFFLQKSRIEEQASEVSRLKEYVSQKGYGLSFTDVGRFKSVEQANREFLAQGVRGMNAGLLHNPYAVEFVSRLQIDHIAVIGGDMHRKLFHTVVPFWPEMILNAFQILIQRGAKKIVVLLYENDPIRFYDKQRVGAVLSAQRDLPVQIKLHTIKVRYGTPRQVQTLSFEEEKIRLSQILEEEQPDAMIGWSDAHYWMLKELGIRIPEDLRYISLSSEGACSGMQTSFFDACKLKVDRVIELIRNQEFGRPKSPVISLYTPVFVDHGTV